MLDRISLTVGAPMAIKYVMDEYPERRMLYFKNAERERYMLMDITGGKQVLLSSDLQFNLLYDNEADTDIWDGFFELRYVTLDKDEKKVFNSLLDEWRLPSTRPAGLLRTIVGQKKHPRGGEYLLITIWDTKGAYLAWRKQPVTQNRFLQFEYSGGPGALVKQYEQLTKDEIITEVNEILAEEKEKDQEEWQKNF